MENNEQAPKRDEHENPSMGGHHMGGNLNRQHQPTVDESVDILKRLAAFNSKKEEMLKKISAIGEKMQKRLGDLKGDVPSGKEILEKELEEARAARNSINHGFTPPIQGAMDDGVPHLHGQHSVQEPPKSIIQKITYTRIRETPKPILTDGCFNISMPMKKVLESDDWKGLLFRSGGDSACRIDDDGLTIFPGKIADIATGLKVSVPSCMALVFATIPGLTILSPVMLTKHYKEMELKLSVRNDTSGELKLLWGVPLFTGHPVKLHDNLTSEELLNSTYDDWIHGSIQ